MSVALSIPTFAHPGAALIASPNSALREQVLRRLNGRCCPVQQALGGADALAKLEKGPWQVLFLDRCLPDLDADELLVVIRRRFPGIEVVLLDSDDEHPEDCPTEVVTDAESFSHKQLHAQRGPAVDQSMTRPLPGMIGTSEAMQHVYRMVRLVAGRPTTVLIVGPTGTGKELVARALHALSPRSAKAFVVVNCAAIPEALLESELFGFARGAFTGAVQAQIGRIPAAHGGTLFLDEVSELPLGMQAKLLRFLEQKEIQRLGTCEVTRVDVRVIAASNADLAYRASRGEFRQDLFYRLAAFPIELPPLAERTGDVVPLAEHFLSCMAAALDVPSQRLDESATQLLERHPWKGNVRELQHVMERSSILAGGDEVIRAEHLYFSHPQREPQETPAPGF
ncbi:MAG TPA: sigma-54 dependent transcriptional regulator [Candidatus Binatia bacterium]|nr:sigma-54 dependent transcriptional regulator [Candidatus Binatia bacterium]